MDVIAEVNFDLRNTSNKLTLRIGRPYFDQSDQNWCCDFAFGRPFEISRTIYGEYSLQVLVLALRTASAYLYGSELYKDGQIGIFGKFGGYLNMPVPKEFADVAPYPF